MLKNLILLPIVLLGCSSPPVAVKSSDAAGQKNDLKVGTVKSNAGSAPQDETKSKNRDRADNAKNLLENYCSQCHGANLSNSGGLKNITDLSLMVSGGYITPGDSKNSRLFSRILSETSPMPPTGQRRPSSGEIENFKKWIDSGAKTDEHETDSVLIDEEKHLRDISEDLIKNVPVEAERKNYRYLSMVPFKNAGANVETLKTMKSGVAKLLNSLSSNPNVLKPEISKINPLLIRFRLDDLGWTQETWKQLEKSHPYQIIPKGQRFLKFLQSELQTAQVYLRADWFLAHCSQPPLYYDLLDLPKTQLEFEKKIGANFIEAAKNKKIIRAGFNNSEVADFSRVIERTVTDKNKFVWHSFEFGDTLNDKNPFDRPFGPGSTFHGIKSAQNLSFNHDGKEVIFSLPNNFLGFYVADGKGGRLDAAPTRTRNSSFVTGTAIVGVACMTCHSQGLLEKRDEIRSSFLSRPSVPEELRDILNIIYPESEIFQKVIQEDTQTYQEALRAAGVDVTQPDPISVVLKSHNDSLDLKAAAGELGIGDMDLKILLTSNLSKVPQVSALTTKGTVSRAVFSVNFQKIMEIIYDVQKN